MLIGSLVEGSAADKIFLIVRGKIHVLTPVKEDQLEDDDPIHKIAKTLENGSIIGDFKPNTYTYRTAEYSECYVLSLESYIKCFSYITKSGRGRKASKKNLTDDFANVVSDVLTIYGKGFVMSEKRRKSNAVTLAAGKIKGLVRRAERSVNSVNIPEKSGRSSRERSRTGERMFAKRRLPTLASSNSYLRLVVVLGDKVITGKDSIVPIIE